MVSLQRILWRTIMVSIGFVAAVAVSVAVVIASLGVPAAGGSFVTAPDAVGLAALVTRAMGGVAIAPVFATVVWPGWLLAAVLAEATGARSLAIHLIGAAVIAVVAVIGSLPLLGLTQIQITAAAGLAAGFAHWLIAGRSAGVVVRSTSATTVEGGPRPPHA